MSGERIDQVSLMPASRFQEKPEVLALLDEPDLWSRMPTTGELYTREPAGQWYLIMACAREWKPEEVTQAGKRILDIREAIKTTSRARGIDLKAVRSGEETLPHDIAVKFLDLHHEASRLAIGSIRLMQTALEKIEGWHEFSDRTKAILFSHGYEGLIRAAKKYNPWYHDMEKRNDMEVARPFSTFAVRAMEWIMKRGLGQDGGSMYFPQHAALEYAAYEDAKEHLTSRIQQDFPHETIVSVMFFRRAHKRYPEGKEIDHLVGHPDQYGVDPDESNAGFWARSGRINKVIQGHQMVHIDLETEVQTVRPTGDDYPHAFASTLEEVIPGDADTENEVAARMMEETIGLLLQELPAREIRVLELRHGLNGYDDHTLEETAQKMGLTRERIRQIEAQGLSRLRHPRIRRMLRDYLTD